MTNPNEMPEVRIENWWYNEKVNNLEGEVYGHPRFPEGTYVYTSNVQAWSENYCITRNTKYILGTPTTPEMAKVKEQQFEEYKKLVVALSKQNS